MTSDEIALKHAAEKAEYKAHYQERLAERRKKHDREVRRKALEYYRAHHPEEL